MKKRTFGLLATCLMLALTICGATSGLAKTEKSGKLTIWAWDPNFNIAVMKEAKARYQKINPQAEVNIVEMAKADVEQKLHTVLASGVKEGLPDIVLIEDYNAQKYLQAYPNAFDNLTTKIKRKNFASYKNALMTLNGKIYGVPFDSGVSSMFVRTDYLQEAGFKPSDLTNITWDQFIAVGKKVKAKTNKAMMAFDTADGGVMRIMLQSAGQWYFDEKGKPAITGNAVIKEAMLTYKKLVDADIIKKVSGWNEWVSAFNKGDTASVITGCWIIGSIKAEKSQSGKWSALPVPRLNAKNSINYSNLGGSSWYITNGSKSKALAEDFLNKTFATDKDFYQKILVSQGAVGTFLPSQNGASYTTADPFFGGQKVYADLSSWMKKIPAVNYGVYTYEADAAMMAAMPEYLGGKITVAAALKKAEAQLKNQIQ
jgi:lactose/L-arabinose transport system substrate-binding protein